MFIEGLFLYLKKGKFEERPSKNPYQGKRPSKNTPSKNPAPMLQETTIYGYSRKNKTKQLVRNEMEGGFKERTSKF